MAGRIARFGSGGMYVFAGKLANSGPCSPTSVSPLVQPPPARRGIIPAGPRVFAPRLTLPGAGVVPPTRPLLVGAFALRNPPTLDRPSIPPVRSFFRGSGRAFQIASPRAVPTAAPK